MYFKDVEVWVELLQTVTLFLTMTKSRPGILNFLHKMKGIAYLSLILCSSLHKIKFE